MSTDGQRGDLPDALYARAVAAMRDGVIIHDATGTVRSCNPRAAEIVGLAAADVIGSSVDRPPWHAVDEDGSAAEPGREPAAVVLATGAPVHDTLIGFRHPDGAVRWAVVSATTLTLPDDTARPGVVTTLVDMSVRETVEERYRSVFHSMQEGAIVMTEDGSVLAMNASAARITSMGSRHDGVGLDAYEHEAWRVYHPNGTVWADADLPSRIAMATGEVQRDILMYGRRSDGSISWLSVNAVPLRLPDGQKGVVTTFSDVTERRVAEDARAESEQRALRLAAEQVALRAVAEAVARAADLGEILELVAGASASVVHARQAIVYRFTAAGTATAYGSVAAGARDPSGDRKSADDAAARVRRTGAPERCLDCDGDLETVAVPVRVGDGLWGALVAGPIGGSGHAEVAESLGRFADLAALAIGEAEARTRLNARAAQQEALRLIGEHVLVLPLPEALDAVVGVVTDALGVDWAGISELHDDKIVLVASRAMHVPGARGVRFPLSGSLVVAAAIAAGRPIAVEDLGADARFADNPTVAALGAASAAAAPILGVGGPWGGITVFSTERATFGADELVFLSAACATLAAAVARHRAEEAIRYQAMHDALTGIANRALLVDRLAHALERAGRDPRQTAVLFCDIDGFRDVNDALGHVAGDQLLVGIAQRLTAMLRPGDTVARLGGDEFVLICEDIAEEREGLGLAERLLQCVMAPFAIAGGVTLNASIGVAVCGAGDEPTQALRDAETAMFRAKAAGRGRIELFDTAMRERLLARVQTQDDLRYALERREFVLHYQPIISLQTGAIVAVEGLVRWRHPTRGVVPPGAFIGIAEETGVIEQLGRFVIARACEDAARWNAARPDVAPLLVSVNLSPRQLGGSDLVGHVRDALADWGLPAGQLGLEITESVLLDADQQHAAQLEELRRLGVRLLLDDFGTGYSSLGYIQRFPLDALKLDRSFVAGLSKGSKDATIVSAVIGLARALGISVVAEGVETIEQLAQLQDLQCHLLQGFYFSRPVALQELEHMLAAGRRWILPAR